MPKTTVVYFKDADGRIPVKDWLNGEVARRDRRAAAKCRFVIRMLRDNGYELRRPYADYLRDGIYELRASLGSINYRILYFFNKETEAVILVHGLTKESDVPARDIDLAIGRKESFETDIKRYSHEYQED